VIPRRDVIADPQRRRVVDRPAREVALVAWRICCSPGAPKLAACGP